MQFGFFIVNDLAQWLSWLERRPVTAEVESSSLFWVVNGIIAQLGEHLPYKQGVTGSSPVGPISYRGVEQRQLVGLITRRSEVRILLPLSRGNPLFFLQDYNIFNLIIKCIDFSLDIWYKILVLRMDSRVAKGGRL